MQVQVADIVTAQASLVPDSALIALTSGQSLTVLNSRFEGISTESDQLLQIVGGQITMMQTRFSGCIFVLVPPQGQCCLELGTKWNKG